MSKKLETFYLLRLQFVVVPIYTTRDDSSIMLKQKNSLHARGHLHIFRNSLKHQRVHIIHTFIGGSIRYLEVNIVGYKWIVGQLFIIFGNNK